MSKYIGGIKLINAKNVLKKYGEVMALDDFSVEIPDGKIGILGPNGAGKSTFVKIALGLITPTSGSVIVLGDELSKDTVHIRQKIGYMPEHDCIPNEMTGVEFLIEMGQVTGMSLQSSTQRTHEMLSHLQMGDEKYRKIGEYSGGMRQKIKLAQGLIHAPELIFMDEPTSSLTQTETDNLLSVVRKLSKSGVSVVFVSHRLAELIEIANRVTVLRDGRLVGVYNSEGMTQSKLTELMTGQKFSSEVAAKDKAGGLKVLEVTDFSRDGEFSNINLKIRKGEILSLTGLIGSGRTELALTLFGRSKPSSGDIKLNGKILKLSSNRDAIEQGIAYVPEDRLSLGLIQTQPISDNLVLPILKLISKINGLISKELIKMNYNFV